jgi:hypothetical protein
VQGVRDPLGGINSLWPLFGIANQMLAAIALCLAVTIILKVELRRGAEAKSETRNSKLEGNPKSEVRNAEAKSGRPWLALVALVPMIWLVSVTFTAGVQKIFHPDPKIGFLRQAGILYGKINEAERIVVTELTLKILSPEDVAALRQKKAELPANRRLLHNNLIDACVAGVFLLLVFLIILASIREWFLLLSRRKQAVLRETPPTWLADYAVADGGRSFGTGTAGAAALALALAKELSSEAALERAQQQACACSRACEGTRLPRSHPAKLDSNRKPVGRLYVEVTEQRFNGVRRCC